MAFDRCRLVGVEIDLAGHTDDGEDFGELRVEATDFELSSIARCAPAISIADDPHNPTSQPFHQREVEHEPVVAHVDQVHQIAAQLLDLALIH